MSVDADLLRAFYAESADIIERLGDDVRRLELAPDDGEALLSLFRGLHTIKGNSSFLSLEPVTRLAHLAEAMLDGARRSGSPARPELVALCRRVLDSLQRRIVVQEEVDDAALLAGIEAFLHGKGEGGAILPPPPADHGVTPPTASARIVGSFVRVDEGKVSKVVSLVSELELIRYSLEKVPERMEGLGRQASDLRFEVDMQVAKLSRLVRSLSGLVFGMRLVPVNQVFRRFPRVVEDLAVKLGKEIRLELANGDAELDKAIVEAVADPMTHLIRNAADHGVEIPEDRERAGKPRAGTIRLNSFVRGNFVFIEISDDGRGIDGDKVLRAAVEKGIVPEDRVSSFTESKKLALIFAPGFSTADKVTDISGRGVGMDVVKSNINRLKGTVIIDSRPGCGTVIQLRFPISVLVVFSLFIEVNDTCCALPVEQVNESVDYMPSELLASVPEGEGTDGYVALYSLTSLLWGEPESLAGRRKYHTLRFKDPAGRNMAFVVDDFSSIEEAVVQSVDSYIAALPGIQGATIRKDGSVGLVLSPESIVEHASRAKPYAYVRVKSKEKEKDAMLADFLGMAG